MEVSAYGQRSAQAGCRESGAQALGEGFGRAEEALGASNVEDARSGIRQSEEFNAGRELGGTFEQDSADGCFGFSGALE